MREVVISGDFLITPPRYVLDLEAALRGTLLGDVEAAVDDRFRSVPPGVATVGAADVTAAILVAAGQ